MKSYLFSTIILSLVLLMSFKGNAQIHNIYGNSGDNFFNRVIPHGSNFYVLGGDDGHATVSRLDNAGNLVWSRILPMTSGWLDGKVMPNGSLAVVGFTTPLDNLNKSLIGEITPGGVFMCIHEYDVPGFEALTRLDENADGTFSAVGYQSPGGDQDVIVLNLSFPGCIINSKKIFNSPAIDIFGQDIEALCGGGYIVAGGVSNQAIMYQVNSSGQFSGGVQKPLDYTWQDVAEMSNCDIVVVGNRNSSGQPKILRLDSGLLPVWERNVSGVSTLYQVIEDANGNILAVGTANVGGIQRAVIIKIDDSSGMPILSWGGGKYLGNVESGYLTGVIAGTSSGNIAFVDGRTDHPAGFGLADSYFSLTDGDVSSCSFLVPIDLIIDPTDFESPEIEIFNYDILPGEQRDYDIIEWNQGPACETCVCEAPVGIGLSQSGNDYSLLCLPHGSPTPVINCLDDVVISGPFGCINSESGDPCSIESTVDWVLTGPNGYINDGQTNNFPTWFFSSSLFNTSGTYYLTLSTLCPGATDSCVCVLDWIVECDSCCTDEMAFLAAAQAVNPFGTLGNCAISFQADGLTDCMQITYDYGDGQSDGPFTGNNIPVTHTYAASDDYVVCYTIEEVANGEVCWEYIHCDTLQVICDSCCTDFTLFCDNVMAAVNVTVDELLCKVNFSIDGLLDCESITLINWGDSRLDFGPFINGNTVMHSYALNGPYTISYTAVQTDPVTGEICFEKTFEIPITVDCDSLCIPGEKDSICDVPIDVLFVLDNSGSINQNEFADMVLLTLNSITQIESGYSNALYSIVHYGGPCGEYTYIEHDFTTAAAASSISRPLYGNDDLHAALGNVYDALTGTINSNLYPTSSSFLNQRPGSNLVIIILTDAYPGISAGCTGSALLPYTNANKLKQLLNARITVVHMDPWGAADPVAAAIASPGGTYSGPVGNNGYDDPVTTGIPGNRQYIPWSFDPNISILFSLPPCDSLQIDCCDSLEVNPVFSNSGGMCCTDISLKNKVGFPVYKLEAEIISSPGWVFNVGSLAYSLGFNWAVFPTGQKLSLGHTSGQIPTGTHANALSYCLASTSATPSSTQTIVLRWYGLLPGDSVATVVCTDTLTTECPKNTGNNCVSIVSSTVNCNPDNPYEYFVNFTVQNLSGTPITQVVLQNLPPGFGFSFCSASAPVTSIALPVSPNPLPNGGISSNLCVKIISPIPILTPQQVCFRLGVVGDSLCCHSTELSCITLQPCCDPCDMVSATYEEIPGAEDGCCYKLDLHRECDYRIFSRVETEILTLGVIFGYHALGGPDASGWTVLPGGTTRLISYAPLSGFINKDKVDDIIQFCLDDINSPAEIPQVVVVRWYSNLYSPERLMCTDTLMFECDADVQCVWVDSEIECLPDSNKYMLTMNVTNHSTIPFNATDFHVSVVSPTDLILTPTGGIFPLSPSLPANNSVTISTCIESASGSFPSSSNYIVLSYRLGFYNGSSFDTCCFENRLDTIFLPSCDTCACPGSDSSGPNLVKNGDFSQGDNFFTSGLTGGLCTCTEGTYCVSDNFQDKCTGWPFLEDHTVMNASGSFLIVDGTQTPGTNLWAQQVTVVPGKTYCFSFWTAHAYHDTLQNFLLDVSIVGNGVPMNIGTAPVSQTTPPWKNHTFTWTCPFGFAPPYIIEINQTSGSQFIDFGIDDICFTKIQPIDTCECGPLEWAEVYGISALPQPAQCNGDFIVVPCEKQGPEFFIHGDFPCLTNDCATDNVAWTLSRPGTLSNVSGVYVFSGSYPHFDIGIPWSDFTTPGVYSLTITRLCGTRMCSCTFNIIVESCPCSCDQLKDDVDKGFVVTGGKASCKRKFKPTQLCRDDIVHWTIAGPGLNVSYAPISATSTLSVSFPSPGGSYNVCMIVKRIDPFTGDTCLREYCRPVIVKCKPTFPHDTIPSITACPGGDRSWNGDFTEGLIWGHLGDGGAVEHWELFENAGNGIVLVEKEGASDDGQVVLIGGANNFAGIVQEIEIDGTFGFLGFNVINYLGSEIPEGTKLVFRIQTEPTGNNSLFTHEHEIDGLNEGWWEISVEFPINFSKGKYFLVVCLQNGDELKPSIVGIDNIELCTELRPDGIESEIVSDLRLYPNPNDGGFSIELPESPGNGIQIAIIGLTGKVEFIQDVPSGTRIQSVHLQNIPNGMYFVRIVSKNQILSVGRFVKQ